MKNLTIIVILFVSLFMVYGCIRQYLPGTAAHIRAVTAKVDDYRLLRADETPEDWLSYGRNYAEDRYSSLKQISKDNIDSLGLAWSINLGTTRGIETTPLVVDGIMYLTGPWSLVYAVDVRSGKMIWTYDPKVPREYGEKACCDVVNRGAALYKGLVFIGSLDGRLIAVDAATGEQRWEVLTVDQSKPYTITGAPRVYDGKVVIGNSGADLGVRGYVTAYDALTGEQLWRFYTVPGDPSLPFESDAMAKAAETWNGEWWKYGGGGTAWDAMAYDTDLNLLYIGTGNGSPWNREFRSPGGGDNLYLSSIVALNLQNGELVWYYQTTPGESWDYTATQHIILADIPIDGVQRKVLMQAPKNGFFYVIDRTNGKLISADPYTYVNWAKSVDLKTGRPVENVFSRYIDVNAMIAPSALGGHNWQPMAFNPVTGLVYIPSRELSMYYGPDKDWQFKDDGRSWNMGVGYDVEKPIMQDSLVSGSYGKLIAWDPVRQKEVWQVRHPSLWNAGVLSTEDLVFQGTAEGNFVAYEANTGEKLWEFYLGAGMIAPPVTYRVDGTQYISIAVGWGGVYGLANRYSKHIIPGTLYTFALGYKGQIPSYTHDNQRSLIDLPVEASEDEIANGSKLYNRYCNQCHKFDGGGSIPDLTYSSAETFQRFTAIVKDGLFIEKGMPKFGDRLSDQDIADIRNYILSMAKKKKLEIGADER